MVTQVIRGGLLMRKAEYAVRLVATSVATELSLLATFMKVSSAIESAGNKLVAMLEDSAGGPIVYDIKV